MIAASSPASPKAERSDNYPDAGGRKYGVTYLSGRTSTTCGHKKDELKTPCRFLAAHTSRNRRKSARLASQKIRSQIGWLVDLGDISGVIRPSCLSLSIRSFALPFSEGARLLDRRASLKPPEVRNPRVDHVILARTSRVFAAEQVSRDRRHETQRHDRCADAIE